jgi:hypothetical protein
MRIFEISHLPGLFRHGEVTRPPEVLSDQLGDGEPVGAPGHAVTAAGAFFRIAEDAGEKGVGEDPGPHALHDRAEGEDRLSIGISNYEGVCPDRPSDLKDIS